MNIMTFKSLQFEKIQCMIKDSLMFLRCFQCDFGRNLKVKFARIMITYFVSLH